MTPAVFDCKHFVRRDYTVYCKPKPSSIPHHAKPQTLQEILFMLSFVQHRYLDNLHVVVYTCCLIIENNNNNNNTNNNNNNNKRY